MHSVFSPQVYFDVKFASGPEIKFPIIILSKSLHSEEEQKTDGLNIFENHDLKVWSSFVQPPTAFNGVASTFESYDTCPK